MTPSKIKCSKHLFAKHLRFGIVSFYVGAYLIWSRIILDTSDMIPKEWSTENSPLRVRLLICFSKPSQCLMIPDDTYNTWQNVAIFSAIGFFLGVTTDKKVQFNTDLLKQKHRNVYRITWRQLKVGALIKSSKNVRVNKVIKMTVCF